MQGSEPRTPPLPPVNGDDVYPIKNPAFSLEDHKNRMAQVWADFEKYRGVLSDLSHRIELLADILKEVPDG